MAASARSSSPTQGGNGARPPQNAERIGARAEKTGTLSGTLAETARRRLIVEDLMKAGLSVLMISGATAAIPRSSVHRAMRAIARAEARRRLR